MAGRVESIQSIHEPASVQSIHAGPRAGLRFTSVRASRIVAAQKWPLQLSVMMGTCAHPKLMLLLEGEEGCTVTLFNNHPASMGCSRGW